MKFNRLLILLFLTIFSVSCNTDDGILGNQNPGNENSGNFSDNFGNSINSDFIGRVIDSNNNPIEGVTITIGNMTTPTDANGVFVMNDALVFERFGYVKADKEGYIHGSRAVVPSSGTNKVEIMLLEETVIQTLNSGETATVDLANGASVSLDGNYKNPDGSDYTGSIDVIMHMLDPVDDNMELQMPGMLYAENIDGNERMLQTLGMLAVELRGDNGEDLNLADGSTSELRIPLDPSLVSTAPSSIPLWYFDETNGYWKEEGEATLIGNEYVGTVSHFSFWNCDIPAEAVNLCVTVTDENENPLANLIVSITSETFGTRGGSTNENGEVCGLIPSNETLEINVYSFDTCGNTVLHTSNIGPYSEDALLDITVMSDTDAISETVTGTFNTCDGDAVTNGYVILTYGSQQFYEAVDNGAFEINMVRCSDDNTFSIEANDYDNVQTTGVINYTFTTPTTNLGEIVSCNSVDEFITYQIDDQPIITYNFNINNFEEGPDSIYISYFEEDNIGANGYYFNLGLFTQALGTHNSDDVDIFIDLLDINGDSINPNNSPNTTVNLTAFGATGEYIDMNFTATYIDTESVTHTISGSIHVVRDF